MNVNTVNQNQEDNRYAGPSLAETREQLDALRAFSFPPDRRALPVPIALQELCKMLDDVVESPHRLLEELEQDDDGLSPELERPFLDWETQCVAEKGWASALWDGDVDVEQAVWAFSRPLLVRRLTLARAAARMKSTSAADEKDLVAAVLARLWPPEPKPRDSRASPWIVQWLTAAVVLLALLFVVTGIGMAYFQQLSRDAAALERETAAKLRRAQSQLATIPVPPTAEERVRLGLDEALSYRVRTYPRTAANKGRLDIELSPLAQPPYVVAVHVQTNPEDRRQIFNASTGQPLEPLVHLDFSDELPASGAKPKSVKLYFSLTGEAWKLSNGRWTMIREIPLLLTADGVSVGSVPVGQVTAAIDHPKTGDVVQDRFPMTFTLGLSEKTPPEELNRMVHLVVRPVDGPDSVRGRYFVTPFRQRVQELAGEVARPFSVLVSLQPALHQAALDQASSDDASKLPTTFDILIVDLPFELLDWTIDRSVLNLDDPAMQKNVILDRCRVKVAPQAAHDAVAYAEH